MRKFIAIILIASVLLQSMSKLLIELNYELNKDYIAKNLCENRDKPQMHCNGKCHLCKQLANTENDNNKSKITQRGGFEFYVTTPPMQFKPKQIHSDYKGTAICGYFVNYFFDPLDAIFHPPGIA